MKKNLFVILFVVMNILKSQEKVMTPELLWKLGRVNLELVSENGENAIYSVVHFDVDTEESSKKIYSIDLKTKKSELLNIGGSNYMYNPKGNLSFLDKTKLWEIDKENKHNIIHDFKDKSISNIIFSPSGDRVLFTKQVKVGTDQNDTYSNYKKANVKIYDDLMPRHWDVWKDTYYSHIFVADYENGEIKNEIDIMPNEKWDSPLKPFGGKEQITWSKDGKKIFYTCKKTFGKDYAFSTNSDIYAYDIEKNKTENISEGMMGYDVYPKISPSGKYLAWSSMKTDGNEADKQDIVIYDIGSKKIYNLTEKWDETIDDFSWSKTDNKIIFRTAKEATYQIFELTWSEKFKVDDKKNIRQITKGWHDITHFELIDDDFVIATKQNMNRANEIYTYNLKDGHEEKISNVNDSIYNDIKEPEVTQRWIKTTDGKKMLVWVILPPDFDKNTKYPAILYCQGGPQSVVSQFYSFRWNFQVMASKGYVVIAPNRRGLPSFGVKWNADISGDWGGQPIDDYLSAVDAIKKESFVDENKIGAVGASYGGYSINMLAGVHKKRFKAFISHCGVISMRDMYGSTEELFFSNNENGGNYWDNPKLPAYNEFDPINHVNKWDTPILIIHGGKDYRIPYTQGLHAFQVAKMKNLPAKFIYFPEENHWILTPQNSLIWHSEFYSWLDKWLK